MDLPAYLIESLSEWCVECDDVYTTEAGTEPTDRHQLGSCRHLAHTRALDPARDMVWQICDRCGGDGVLRGWPGTYTESDRAEWSDDDYEDYAETRRRCDNCDGTGKVRDFTDEAYERPVVMAWIKDYYDDQRASAMERRMGA